MPDAVLFAVIFIAFFVLRIIAATIFFFYMLPASDRCPLCDTPTIRVRARVWNALLPWFRTSWCYNCHWEGMLRPGESTPSPSASPSTRPSGSTR
jgi:hypothetical protein